MMQLDEETKGMETGQMSEVTASSVQSILERAQAVLAKSRAARLRQNE